jgi:hypothetical protein
MPPHLLLLLELLAQLVLGLLNLGLAGFHGLLECTIMPQPGLDQLLLKSCSLILLSLQRILVLEGELILLD